MFPELDSLIGFEEAKWLLKYAIATANHGETTKTRFWYSRNPI